MSSGDRSTDLVLNGIGATARVELDNWSDDVPMVGLRMRWSARDTDPQWFAISPLSALELARQLLLVVERINAGSRG